MIKRIAVLITVGILSIGCRKHEDGSTVSPGGLLPGSGSTNMMTYSGAVSVLDSSTCLQTCKQTIATNANVLDFPSDSVNVYLCRNADCSVGIPAKKCSEIAVANTTAACVTTIPSPEIVLGKNVVQLVNAYKTSCVDQACTSSIPGYSSYLIQTIVSR